MKILSKFIFFSFLTLFSVFAYLLINSKTVKAQEAYPAAGFPCGSVNDIVDPEFHSLRPYQASVCADAVQSLYCSNELIFIEEFDLSDMGGCEPQYEEGKNTFTCNPEFHVEKHNLFVELQDSMMPILGNTEMVKNSQGGTEILNDAQKMNEYASWYLSGVARRAEYGEPTNEQVIDYSGPVNKLVPHMIQEAQRIETISNLEKIKYTDDNGNEFETMKNHNQIVVCGNVFKVFGIELGRLKPTDCYNGNAKVRLDEWLGDLSDLNKVLNRFGGDVWNKRTPPLPWSDMNGVPFETEILYKKAYNEWQGKSCLILPIIGLQCVENPLVKNKWAELYSYIPLSATTDKRGVNNILGDGPSYTGGAGTKVANGTHSSYVGAPLYVAHAQEVKELSYLLNQTYMPQGVESVPVSETTEKNDCSVLNVRVNSGDNLFPGDRIPNDTEEMWVLDVEYDITEVKCEEEFRPFSTTGCGLDNAFPCQPKHSFKCPAYVELSIKTGTKTPLANEIFAQTVADSGSTFRRIFPKVGENAPVTCIADIPTVTDVTYIPQEYRPVGHSGGNSETGSQDFKIKNNPIDGYNTNPQLTFPHIGSIYEYFLKGIQTALRPQGYGQPIANGNCYPTVEESCDVNVPDSAVPSKYLGGFKDNFISLADRWSAKCPGAENNMAEECYNFVVSIAQKEGVNPAFALTIWLNESGASNYCEGGDTTQDMGVNLSELYLNLPGQLLKFVELAKQKFCSGMPGFTEPMHGWLSRYQSSSGICDPSDTTATQYYYDVMNNTWEWVSGCAGGGKFGIQWPTDFNCP